MKHQSTLVESREVFVEKTALPKPSLGDTRSLGLSSEETPSITEPEVKKLQAGQVRPKRALEAFSLEGKVTVVTGGASGIGLEICRAIVASGGEVAIIDLNSSAAEQQVKLLRSSYRQLHDYDEVPLITAHTADVASPTSIDLAIVSVLQQHKTIDHLVTCAGICENFPAISYPYSRMQKLWSINVDGTYCFATAVAKQLIHRGVSGNMVFIGSMSGSIVNVPQLQTPYNVSKAAVRHMARSLAVEWAGFGIRVNCISPGYMRTPLTEEIMRNDPPLYAEWVARTPLGSLGKPADIGGAAVFLLSDASSYMTGSEVLIDGGYSAI